MYRQYEDPRALTKQYEREKAEYDRLSALGALTEDEQFSMHEDLAELKERINFAWQDEEFGEMLYHEEDWC